MIIIYRGQICNFICCSTILFPFYLVCWEQLSSSGDRMTIYCQSYSYPHTSPSLWCGRILMFTRVPWFWFRIIVYYRSFNGSQCVLATVSLACGHSGNHNSDALYAHNAQKGIPFNRAFNIKSIAQIAHG